MPRLGIEKTWKNRKVISIAEVLGDAAVVIWEGRGLGKGVYLKPGSWRCSGLVGGLDNEGVKPQS